MRIQVLLIAGVLSIVQGTSDALAPVGSFGNVRQGQDGEHCYGYSLELWRHNGKLIGLLDHHQGLCGDPPCEALRNVSYDARSGRLSFSALDVNFTGTLRRDDVAGTIGRDRLRLSRHRDHPIDAKSDESFAAWCTFWSSVSRCKGVREVCTAAGQ